jgi:hypothetical protein
MDITKKKSVIEEKKKSDDSDDESGSDLEKASMNSLKDIGLLEDEEVSTAKKFGDLIVIQIKKSEFKPDSKAPMNSNHELWTRECLGNDRRRRRRRRDLQLL